MIIKFTSNCTGYSFIAHNSRGKIVSFTTNNRGDVEEILIIPILDDKSLKPSPLKIVRIKETLEASGSNDGKLYEREQFPIDLFISSNIHVLQGVTWKHPETIVFSNFRLNSNPSKIPNMYDEYGAFYMLLTRVENPDQLFFLTPVEVGDIKAHPAALKWSNYHSGGECSTYLTYSSSVSIVDYRYELIGGEMSFIPEPAHSASSSSMNYHVKAEIKEAEVSPFIEKVVKNYKSYRNKLDHHENKSCLINSNQLGLKL
jgi:hypothetical protein